MNKWHRNDLHVFSGSESYPRIAKIPISNFSRHHKLFLKIWFSWKIMKAAVDRLGSGQRWTRESIEIILTPIYTHLFIQKCPTTVLDIPEGISWSSADRSFSKKFLIFHDAKHDAKNRLSLPSPSPEKPLAEIHQLKKNDLGRWPLNVSGTENY